MRKAEPSPISGQVFRTGKPIYFARITPIPENNHTALLYKPMETWNFLNLGSTRGMFGEPPIWCSPIKSRRGLTYSETLGRSQTNLFLAYKDDCPWRKVQGHPGTDGRFHGVILVGQADLLIFLTFINKIFNQLFYSYLI